MFALLLSLIAGLPAQAQLWVPTDLSTNVLKNWYDAADTNTMWQDIAAATPTTANGQTVMYWKDKSGNSNDVNGTSGPIYTTNVLNSLPVLNFNDNTLDRTTNLAMGGMSDNYTVVGVFAPTAQQSFDVWVTWGLGGQATGDFAAYLDGNARQGGAVGSMEFAYNGGVGAFTSTDVVKTNVTPIIFIGSIDQENNLFSAWLNGTAQTPRSPVSVISPSSALKAFRIGFADFGPYYGNNPKGDIAELIVINTGSTNLDVADRQRIEGYLANKWWGTGAANPLPQIHPYKNIPPALNQSVYTITASNGTGGTVTPAGTNNVAQGQNLTFSITPATGNSIRQVIVDGESIGAVTNYTFSNVQTNHTITADFAVGLPPSSPAGLAATATEGKVSLTWSASAGVVTFYEVKRATVPAGPYTTIGTPISTSYIDSAVINGSTYYYVVSAANDGGESADSSQVSATPQLNTNLWRPSALGSATLKNWYDSADFGTLWQDQGGTLPLATNGQAVLYWSDKSGNGNDINGADGPAYSGNAMNLQPALTFQNNTLDRNGSLAMGDMSDNYTVIGVFAPTAQTSFDVWVSWGIGNGYTGDIAAYVDGNARSGGSVGSMEFAYNGGVGAYTAASVVKPSVTPVIFVGAVDQENNLFSAWLNGASQISRNPTSVITPSPYLDQFRIGAADGSGNNPKGDIAELIIINTGTTNLDDANRQRIEGYLANKWWGSGTNNPLPATHPYKNVPPSFNLSLFTITASSGSGGTVSPSGTSDVPQGQNLSFSVAPLTGYFINDVKVDGASVGAVTNYQFTNVQTNHIITASFTAGGAPSSPTGLTATASEDKVLLNWTPATGVVVFYNLKRATVPGGPYTTIVSPTATSYIDPTVINGTTYYYVVSAANYGGESTDSSQVSATPQLDTSLWRPSALGSATLKNWYDSADFGTLWQDEEGTVSLATNGQQVLYWSDKSGNSNDISGANGPDYATTVLNSLPVLAFNDSTLDRTSNIAMGTMSNNYTVIGVFAPTAQTSFDVWVSWGLGSEANGDMVINLDGNPRPGGSYGSIEFSYEGGVGSYTASNVVSASVQPILFIGSIDQVGNLFSTWLNGIAQVARAPAYVTSPSSALDEFRIGLADSGGFAGNNPKGDIAELIILNTGATNLSVADRQRFEGYLANKWWGSGTNNPLPVAHPYKNGSPINLPPAPVLSQTPPYGIKVTGGVVSLTFATVSGYQYQVVYKNELTDLAWQVVAPGFVTSTGADMTVTDSGAAGRPHRFYEVEAANP